MRETKTVQVYPSDSIINDTISEYGSFGWEVIGNQRCQEYEGQTHGVDGSVTNHYTTFNKITFSREKSSAWYEEVSKLESEYFTLKDTSEIYSAQKPVLKKVKPEGINGVLLGILLYLMYIVPGIIYTVVRCCKKSKYNKQYQKDLAAYNSEYPAKIKEIENRCSQLRANAEMLVNGRA